MPKLQAVFTRTFKIILLKKITAASLYTHTTASFWLYNPLQAFAMVSLRRMAITSVIFVIREAAIVVGGGHGLYPPQKTLQT
jgi:hypothetical protein